MAAGEKDRRPGEPGGIAKVGTPKRTKPFIQSVSARVFTGGRELCQ